MNFSFFTEIDINTPGQSVSHLPSSGWLLKCYFGHWAVSIKLYHFDLFLSLTEQDVFENSVNCVLLVLNLIVFNLIIDMLQGTG